MTIVSFSNFKRCLVNKDEGSNTNKSNYDSKTGKKIKILKYSNIEYAKDGSTNMDKQLNTASKSQVRKKSQTSAGFSIENRLKPDTNPKTPISNFKYKETQKKIRDFVDDELDISYNEQYDSPLSKTSGAHKVLSRLNTKGGAHKETESIVPPLALKNISSSKNTQNTATGKLTRTTMNTTQIRDKLPLNNLKSAGNTGHSNHKSNTDCKLETFK